MKKLLKVLSVLLCMVALVVGSVAATVAYLAMETNTVEHTFTAGNINIALNSTANITEKMMPGESIVATRAVTVKQGSEKCYLFVEVTKQNNFDKFLTYEMAGDWTLLSGTTGVYYRVVEANETANQEFKVFDYFTANANCTKKDYDEIPADAAPNVTLTAYAVQFVGFANSVEGAWEVAQGISQNTLRN